MTWESAHINPTSLFAARKVLLSPLTLFTLLLTALSPSYKLLYLYLSLLLSLLVTTRARQNSSMNLLAFSAP